MAKKFVGVANGLKLTFATSGFVLGITGVSHSGVGRALIEVSDMDSEEPGEDEIGGKEFIVDPLEDPGQLQVQGHYDPSSPPKRTDPDTPEDIVVEYRKVKGFSQPARLVGKGWLQDWSSEQNLGTKMTTTLTVKFTGKLSVVKAGV